MSKTPPKITYLLGAGASYEALPVITELLDCISYMLEYVKRYENNNGFNYKHNVFDHYNNIIQEISKHFSIDTLARKLWIKSGLAQESTANNDYINLVKLINCAIIFSQLEMEDLLSRKYIDRKKNFKQTIDPRYEAFFAALIDENCNIPRNINFVSWNYDTQIEKALKFYFDNLTIHETGENYGIDYLRGNFFTPSNPCQIFKLNGTALFLKDDNLFSSGVYTEEMHKVFYKLLSTNGDKNTGIKSLIKFAWDNQNDNYTKSAAKIVSESDYIVVIGYSFPIFNREVDINIFKGLDLTNVNKTFQKIYIQAPADKVNLYIEQLDSIKPGLRQYAEPITNLDQFFIPNQYWNNEIYKPKQSVRARSF